MNSKLEKYYERREKIINVVLGLIVAMCVLLVIGFFVGSYFFFKILFTN